MFSRANFLAPPSTLLRDESPRHSLADLTKEALREKETDMGASEEESAGGIAALHVLEGTFSRMDAVRGEGEDRTDFIREAVERELKRRERTAQR
jgi:hypothetical protein